MAKPLRPDICVIGAGSGGLTVAAAAAAFGVSVVLVEKGRMGGDCLNYGCVPSKALIAAGRRAQAMREAAPFGVEPVEPDIEFRKVHRHVKQVIAEIAPNDSAERFRAMGVRVIEAEARFTGKRTVVAGDQEIRARRFVIATGSSPAVPPIPGLDEVGFLTNETVFELTRRPSHLVIVGGGPVGMELAQAHRRLGSQVTVIEAAAVLGHEDPELARVVASRLREEGVTIREHTTVSRVERHGRYGVRLHLEHADGASTVEGSHLLVATGRRPNVDGLGLEAAKIAFGDNGIKVSSKLRTTNRRVYAIGDVAGGPQFTHVANYQAGLVVRSILFRLPARQDTAHLPRAMFTDPEIAQVGQTEAEARRRHGTVRVLRWPYAENDRAVAERTTSGFVKMVTDRKGRILGVGIVGKDAAEMINFWSLALTQGLTTRDVATHVAPYPTLTEIGKRAAISYFSESTRRPAVRRLIRLLRLFG